MTTPEDDALARARAVVRPADLRGAHPDAQGYIDLIGPEAFLKNVDGSVLVSRWAARNEATSMATWQCSPAVGLHLDSISVNIDVCRIKRMWRGLLVA